MDINTFNQTLEFRLDKIKATLFKKATEYSRSNDRLYNFKRAAVVLNITDIEALTGMMAKHLVSVLDIIEDAKKGVLPNDDLRDEKLGDMINYLILLEAMLIEKETNAATS